MIADAVEADHGVPMPPPPQQKKRKSLNSYSHQTFTGGDSQRKLLAAEN